MNLKEVLEYLKAKEQVGWVSVGDKRVEADKVGLIDGIKNGSEIASAFLAAVEVNSASMDIPQAVEKALTDNARETRTNVLGKRYRCECGTEVLATKAGDGQVSCCGKPMEEQVPRPLPSSD